MALKTEIRIRDNKVYIWMANPDTYTSSDRGREYSVNQLIAMRTKLNKTIEEARRIKKREINC